MMSQSPVARYCLPEEVSSPRLVLYPEMQWWVWCAALIAGFVARMKRALGLLQMM